MLEQKRDYAGWQHNQIVEMVIKTQETNAVKECFVSLREPKIKELDNTKKVVTKISD